MIALNSFGFQIKHSLVDLNLLFKPEWQRRHHRCELEVGIVLQVPRSIIKSKHEQLNNRMVHWIEGNVYFALQDDLSVAKARSINIGTKTKATDTSFRSMVDEKDEFSEIQSLAQGYDYI